jgi:chromosomal replication initiation ATPase DnaA
MIALAQCRRIIETVARERLLTREEIISRSRSKRTTEARAAAARLLFDHEVPVNEIARQLERHHATIQYYLGRSHRERPVTARTDWRLNCPLQAG